MGVPAVKVETDPQPWIIGADTYTNETVRFAALHVEFSLGMSRHGQRAQFIDVDQVPVARYCGTVVDAASDRLLVWEGAARGAAQQVELGLSHEC